jgi:putative membrane-bound dehydrogenase-like protein
MKNAPVTILLFLQLLSFVGAAMEPTLSSNDLPRFPPVAPEAALRTFKVRRGFHMELVAAEPNVISPVAVSFDENGRMFVVEMVDYSERRDEVPHLGRIRMLEDLDGDGVYEKSTVFATNLAWPTAVFCYNGGVFVAATPDILYLKDTNGDGKADVRETVFAGFAEGSDRINVQEMLNTFIWGLDNRIHGATSGEGGVVKSLRHPETKALNLHGRDFVIDPRGLTITSEAGGGQHGLSFDDIGRRFTCNNSDHLRLFMYDDAYAARNPFYSMPAALRSIAVDGPAAEVYRISPDEPWRVIRTKWRVGGLVPGPIEGGGRPSGYFTAATGVTIYRGDAYPKEFLGNAFVADCAGNLIHRKLLIPDDVGLKGERAADEQKVEFVASKDTWFRPVQFASAPDGTLYVIDMYREIIEHPWSLPENLKKLLDLNSGFDRGRIYRIAADAFKPPARPRLGKYSTAELVATLENRNGWHRDTASRLLYERQDLAAVPLLAKLLESSHFELARLHALYALQGLGALTSERVLKALNDSDAGVRRHAVKLSEPSLKNDTNTPKLIQKLKTMTDDPSPIVRYQLAFTMGEIDDPLKGTALSALARSSLGSSWTKAAILSSLAQGANAVFDELTTDTAFCSMKQGVDFLRELVVMIGSRHDQNEVAGVFGFINKSNEPALQFELLQALGDGLKRGGVPLDINSENAKGVFASATRMAGDASAPEESRTAAIRLLGLTSFEQSGSLLLNLLSQKQPQEIQLAAVASLNRFDDPRLGPELIKAWTRFTPRLRSDVIVALLARPDRAKALLEGIQAAAIRPAVLTSAQSKFLRNHRDSAVRELAARMLDASTPGQRQSVIDAFTPALSLTGQAAAGKKIYEERCISCHRLGGEGNAVGPDLATVKSTGREKLLVSILDPNREVAPQYVSYVVETREGDSFVGLVVNETSSSVTVRQAYSKEDVIQRSQIASMRSQAQSLMPEGLEAGLTQQDMANLLEYIETANAAPKAERLNLKSNP